MKIYGSGLLQAKMKPFNDKKVSFGVEKKVYVSYLEILS